MPWIAAAIGAGGSLLGGALGADSAGDAADAQLRASREANNLAYAQYLTSLGLNEPWRQTGHSALNELNALFGYGQSPYQSGPALAQQYGQAGRTSNTRLGARAIAKMLKQGMSISDIASMGSLKNKPDVLKRLAKKGLSAQDIATLQAGPWGQMQTQGAPAQPSASGPTGLAVFQESPDYQFRREQGMEGIGNSFAARGGAFSGNALKALNEYNSDLASGEFQNFINRRMALAGYGQQATGNQQQAAQNYGFQGMGAIQQGGDARASGIANQGNMWGNAISGAANAFGNYWGSRPSQPFGQQYQDYMYYGNQRNGT